MNSILNLQSSHRSVRKFKDRPVEESLFRELVKTAQCAATSHHVQAYVVIRVKDGETRKQIADLAGPQPWVEQAPVFLIFCADLTRLESVCLGQGLEPETAWAEQFIVATVDTAILAQNLMIAAESQGLGGVFIGGIRNDPARICELLEIPRLAYPVFGMCLGYPDHQPDIKPRLPLDLVLREDRFYGSGESRVEKDLARYDRTMREYYLSRDSNIKDQTWQGQMADFMSRVIRPHMKSFLEERGFFLK
ncbi:oxygen-insensitive NADPH nitroreductase [Desulfospira joergensenii]|uniref:oxygen-insensitive NADPH nitroreductase n=1 Tax=Desulfospira joergensenii TaxID=53329 RepID=UPI0004855D2C|nr:oxygen-insensitive NADPH nitroreductase [Desulfospira joergensenii]